MRSLRERRLFTAPLGLDTLALVSVLCSAAPAMAQNAAAEEQNPPAENPTPSETRVETKAGSGPSSDDASAETTPAPSPAQEATEANKPKPPPYSLPFALRPAVAATVVRLDTTMAFYEDPVSNKSGTTTTPVLTASYKITKELAPLLRVGVFQNSPPAGDSGFGFTNPLLGATYALSPSPELKLAFFAAVTVPIGSGGGNQPDPPKALARNAGIWARSAMDNALFAVNDFTVIPGVDFAFVSHGFTAQAEATLLQLTRVRGADAQKDSSKTNFTAGLHLGYFLAPFISLGVELRHQRWLSTPVAVKANDALRDTTTVAFGPRFHFQIGESTWFRPAITLALPLDDPMKKSSYKIVQLDLPFSF